jgi:hypothetical protein
VQAVRAIGRCAVSLENAAQRCIAVLLELIQTKVNYVVQEAVIVIKVRTAQDAAACCCDSALLAAAKDCTGCYLQTGVTLHGACGCGGAPS